MGLEALYPNRKRRSQARGTRPTAAVKIPQNLYPTKHIFFGFPYTCKNAELAKLAPSFTITHQAYIKHQFADPVTLKNGKRINKPANW
jgi:hypothetical protein